MKRRFKGLAIIIFAFFTLIWWIAVDDIAVAKSAVLSHSGVSGSSKEPYNDERIAHWARRVLENQRFNRELITQVSANDRAGSAMARFHEEHANYGVIIAPWVVLAAQPDPKKLSLGPVETKDFEVVVAEPEERYMAGFAVHSSFEFSPEDNRMYLPPPGGYTRLWYGALMVHEVVHAYDINTGYERRGSQGEEWARGELRAYTIEHRLLDLATKHAWTKAVDEILDNLRVLSDDRPLFAFWPKPGSLDRLYALFEPSRSQDELDMRNGAMIMAINFRYADRKRLGDGWKLRMMLASRRVIQ